MIPQPFTMSVNDVSVDFNALIKERILVDDFDLAFSKIQESFRTLKKDTEISEKDERLTKLWPEMDHNTRTKILVLFVVNFMKESTP